MTLCAENYYSPEADTAYFSVSQIKRFLTCEAAAKDGLDHPQEEEKTTALLVGGYVDAHFAGEMDAFLAENPQVVTRGGKLKAAFQQAEDIIARIEADELAMRMMAGEKQRILTGEIDGYPFKVKPDVLLSGEQADAIAADYPGMSDMAWKGGAIVDLKVMRDFEPMYRPGEGRMSFVEYWRYDLQMAVYQEIVRQNTGKKLPCYILAASKQDPPGLALVEIEQEDLDFCLNWLRERLPHIAAVKRGEEEPEACGSCAHCRKAQKLTGPMGFIEGRLMAL